MDHPLIDIHSLKMEWQLVEQIDNYGGEIKIAILKHHRDGSRSVIQPDGTIAHVPPKTLLESVCQPTVKIFYPEFLKLIEGETA